MPRSSIPSWLSGLATPALEGVTDEQLLRRFHSDRDEVAFRVLLGRHGPMVLGVCRRILADEHDAEDAFQATFVVLARRCRQADREQLGPWLYEIARRTALKARVLAQRRRGHERRAACARVGIDQPLEPMTDLRAVIDDEIARLPPALRLAVILCELQGLTRRQAATTLSCPESTLSSRLAVARTRLANRLSSRGITLSLAGLFGIVPPALAERCIATVQTIMGRAETTTPSAILALSTEVLQAMSRTKKLSMVATLVVGFAACGSILTAAALADQEPIPVKARGGSERSTAPNLDRFEFVAFDGFDGQLGLNWKVIRPDDSHVSLRTHPGKLTIRTQRGSIHAGGGIPFGRLDLGGQLPPGTLAPGTIGTVRFPPLKSAKGQQRTTPTGSTKNLYLIDNPLVKGGDFTATTCIVDFRPSDQYQQAGLLLYGDDDNYLKWTYEFNDGFLPAFLEPGDAGMNRGGDRPRSDKDRPYFVLVAEREGNPTHHIGANADPRLPRVWLRVAKRGNVYDFYTSLDGVRFIKHGSTEWGRGGPPKIGLIAQNGRDSTAADIDAQFEFFELRGR